MLPPTCHGSSGPRSEVTAETASVARPCAALLGRLTRSDMGYPDNRAAKHDNGSVWMGNCRAGASSGAITAVPVLLAAQSCTPEMPCARMCIGWVERSETHRHLRRRKGHDGF